MFLLFFSSYCLSPPKALFVGGLSQQFVFLSCCWILRHGSYFFHLFPELRVGSPSVVVDPLYHNSCVAGVDSKLADGSLLTKKAEKSLHKSKEDSACQFSSFLVSWRPGWCQHLSGAERQWKGAKYFWVSFLFLVLGAPPALSFKTSVETEVSFYPPACLRTNK